MIRGGLRKSAILVTVTILAIFLAGCGGGGGTTSSTGSVTPGAQVGPAAVEITLAAAPVTGSAAALVTVAGPASVPTLDPSYLWPEHVTDPTPRIAHVYMDVVKVSLMPAEEPFSGEDIDQDGNLPDPQAPSGKPRFVTIVPDSPICIDLLKLDNDKRFARFLNRFDSVPAGTYDKIRVYYQNVRVILANGDELPFHPTANSKFDIHFRQGHELVIPSTTDTTQDDGWVRLFRVKIDFVGLKLNVVPRGNGKKGWDSCKVILRPQIFAVAGNDVLYSVAGTADNVTGVASPTVEGTFDLSFGVGQGYPRIIHTAFHNGTTWAYSDNVLGGSHWIVDVSSTTGFGAFRNGAIVEVIGRFDTSKVLQARDIVFTFPDLRRGVVDNGWRGDNTFVLRSPSDNVVFPKPDRSAAYYDNAVAPHFPLSDDAIDNNVRVKARGYTVRDPAGNPVGIEAYWISIGGIFPGP